MANYNKVLLMGNLTRDPEVRYSGSGSPICKFGLAVNRQWRDQAGQQQEETCFVDIVVFGRQAETCGEYLHKGRPVFVEGRLSFSSWEDRESGAKRSKLEVVGERVQFLGAPGAGGGGRRDEAGGRREQGGGQGARPEQPARVSAGEDDSPRGGSPEGIDFDDIPF